MGKGFVCRANGAKAAEILIYEDVGEGWFGGVSAKQFADELRSQGDVDRIDVRINSYGGDVFDGLAIYNTLVRHPAKVTTHVDGIAASIASIIAMAGNEIRMAESAWMMVHEPWGMSVGNATTMREYADQLDATAVTLRNVYAARSGRDAKDIAAWMADETWFDAQGAIDAKLADTMAENLKLAARAIPERFAFRHAPDAIQRLATAAQPPLKPHPANADVRAQMEALNQRMRRVASLSRTRGAMA